MPTVNFTGTWKFNPAKSDLEITAPDSTIFVIDHREPYLALSRTHVAGGKSDTFTLELTTDGQEVSARIGDVDLRSRAFWDGNVLVFDSTLVREGTEGHNVVRYSMDSAGATLTADERFRSSVLIYDNVWVLDRI